MHTTIKKSIAGIITLTTIILVSGTGISAQDQMPGNVVSADDLAFIQAQPTGTVTKVANRAAETAGGPVASADHTFAAQPYKQSAGNRRIAAAPQPVGIITVADYKFVTTGHSRDVFANGSDFADSMAGRRAK